jgi:hypothetical protein
MIKQTGESEEWKAKITAKGALHLYGYLQMT